MAKVVEAGLAPVEVQERIKANNAQVRERGVRLIRMCQGGSNCMHHRKKTTKGNCSKCSGRIDHGVNGDVLIRMGGAARDKDGTKLFWLCIPCWHNWHREWDSEACTEAECFAWLQIWQEKNPWRVDQVMAPQAPEFLAVTAEPPAAPMTVAIIQSTTVPPPPSTPPPTMREDVTSMMQKLAVLQVTVAEAIQKMDRTVRNIEARLADLESTPRDVQDGAE